MDADTQRLRDVLLKQLKEMRNHNLTNVLVIVSAALLALTGAWIHNVGLIGANVVITVLNTEMLWERSGDYNRLKMILTALEETYAGRF